MARSEPQMNIRMPDSLSEAVRLHAEANGRSITAEVVHVLTSSYAADATRGYAITDLRDWFAGQAIAGLLANSADVTSTIVKPGELKARAAGAAYRIADAMLAERAKP